MSDDIDRLKGVLEDLRNLNDALTDGSEATRDIVAAVAPIDIETDTEGHEALRDLAADIRRANIDTQHHINAIHESVTALCEKARA